MDRQNRIGKILEILESQEITPVKTIIARIPVSRETIRKDLEHLESQSLVVRERRGIRLINPAGTEQYLKTNGLLTKHSRQQAIEKKLKEKKQQRISTLALEFGVTQATIRNDIRDLKKQSNILKNHGFVSFDSENDIRLDLDNCSISLSEEEVSISGRILKLIRPGEIVYLADNQINCYIAEHLEPKNQNKIFTDSLRIASILFGRDCGIDIILPGGHLDQQYFFIRLGTGGESSIPTVINKAFFAFAAYKDPYGFYVDSFGHLSNLKLILDRTKDIIPYLHSKNVDSLGPVGFSHNLFEHAIRELLVDDSKGEDVYKNFEKLSFPVTICGKKTVRRINENSRHRIGFVYLNSNSYYAKTVQASIEHALNQHKELALTSISVNEEIREIQRQVRWAVSEGIRILVVYVNNYEIGHLISEFCTAAHIQIIAIDTSIPNSIFYGAHNSEAGKIGGKKCIEYVRTHWDGKLDSIISIEKQDAGTINSLRLSSMIQILEDDLGFDHKKNHHLDISTLNRIPKEELTEYIQAHMGKHNVFLSFSEKTTMQIAPIVAKFPDNVQNIIIGHNYNSRVHELMKEHNSPIIGCIAYYPETYGENVIQLVERIINNQDVSAINYTHHEWIPNPNFSNLQQ